VKRREVIACERGLIGFCEPMKQGLRLLVHWRLRHAGSEGGEGAAGGVGGIAGACIESRLANYIFPKLAGRSRPAHPLQTEARFLASW